MSDQDIDERDGLGYAKSVDAALALVDEGDYDVAFILRRSRRQVKDICDTD